MNILKLVALKSGEVLENNTESQDVYVIRANCMLIDDNREFSMMNI